ncbi:competence protein CoiA family protein [Nocardia coubleae]|uniref:Competence protein CoiA nuclease-like domain-containing protein n=1 Tax=Nocardia coubleae TaxID=356147 RepID=A0A846W457_9NOCA|nr:competence protein CoiA family protein [Nocardia coubleae]NKX88022.1 hypothetical protein [Nocardia coubleae]
MGDDQDPCVAFKMNAALDPYRDHLIDIRVDENWEQWHGIGKLGLRCVLCRRVVTPFLSTQKNRFVRHQSGEGASASTAAKRSAHESFLHQRCKYWVADQLREAGAIAEVERQLGDRRPDVLAVRDGRRFAVEVQWSSLSLAAAQERTADLRRAGADEVMWLTRGYTWVEKLPTLGLHGFNPGSDGYTTEFGFLALTPSGGLRTASRPVRQALHQWLDGEIAWAYRDVEKAGWATVQDWAKHTKQQAEEIERLGGELGKATDKIERLSTTVRKQSARIDAVESDLKGAKADLSLEQDKVEEGKRQRPGMLKPSRKLGR